MYSCKNFNVGDQACFIYNGGTRPGARRIVDVESVENSCIRGFDHYTKEERCFSYNKMIDLLFNFKKVVSPEVTITYSNDICSIVKVVFNNTNIVFKFLDNLNTNELSINGKTIRTLEELKNLVKNL